MPDAKFEVPDNMRHFDKRNTEPQILKRRHVILAARAAVIEQTMNWRQQFQINDARLKWRSSRIQGFRVSETARKAVCL